MEEVKMQYRDYKRHYANCETVRGSYDASSKTIIVLVPASMMQPKRSASRFDPKRWENRGQQKKLRGYRVAVRQYNQGKDASYLWRRGEMLMPAYVGSTPRPQSTRPFPAMAPPLGMPPSPRPSSLRPLGCMRSNHHPAPEVTRADKSPGHRLQQ